MHEQPDLRSETAEQLAEWARELRERMERARRDATRAITKAREFLSEADRKFSRDA